MAGVETFVLSGRDRALLRAVEAGRCRLGAGCEPVLLVDGLVCADFSTGTRLVAAGLVAPPEAQCLPGPARLTAVGLAALEPAAS